ncbi:unnamed protein product [Rhizophagus irregularis]|nr:unnamed protein product [Rhizophagus irregularis]
MDTRVVVAIDFGTTFSGFAYSNQNNPEIITNDIWPQQIGSLKTNTVLQYDSNYQNVIKWGNPALAKKINRRKKDSSSKSVELFKLHLGNIPQNEKPPLPHQLSYEKAISDYLHELGKLIKEIVTTRWDGLRFFEHVLLVISVPAEFNDHAKDTMRKCLYNAGLTDSKESKKVEFTTEPEAAAIYFMRNLNEHDNGMIPINGDWKVGDPTGPNYQIKKEGNVDRIRIFDCFVTRGTRVEVDQEFSNNYKPHKPAQTVISFPIYITTNLNITEFYDESCMKLLGKLTIDLPDAHLGRSRKVEFSLIFGKMEIVAKAKNLQNGRTYNTRFELELS